MAAVSHRISSSAGGHYLSRQAWLIFLADLNRLAEIGDIKGVEACYKGALASGARVGEKTVVLNLVLKACAKRGDPRKAVAWFCRLREAGVRANVKTYGKLIEAAAKGGEASWAEFWLEAMSKEFELTAVAVGATVDACARVVRWDSAIRLLERSSCVHLKSDRMLQSNMVRILTNAGQTARAVDWLGSMEASTHVPDAPCYNEVLHAFARAGQVEKAVSLFKRMERISVSPTIVSYGCLIDAFAKRGRAVEAVEWLRQISKEGLHPNRFVCNSAISACAKASHVTGAEQCFNTMLSAGLQPDLVSYSGLATAFARASRPADAIDCFHRAQAAGLNPDVGLHNAVLLAHAKARQWPEALMRLGDLQASRVTPTSGSYTSVMLACDLSAGTANSSSARDGDAANRLLVEGLLRQMLADSIELDHVALGVVAPILGDERLRSYVVSHT